MTLVENRVVTHIVNMSPKIATPRADAATPRIADETMCVIGDVTFIERTLAIESRKPTLPWANIVFFRQSPPKVEQTALTVATEPMTNVQNPSARPERRSSTAGPSPRTMMNGTSSTELSRLEYQLMDSALPSTTLKPRFITAACSALSRELEAPKKTPRPETWVPSRKTPAKKPEVTIEHENRMR